MRSVVIGAILATVALTTAACRGKVSSGDIKSDIVGTWTRSHEGKVVQEITFTADGKFDSVNPLNGGAKERSTYSFGADGKSVSFAGTDVATNTSASYSWQVRLNGKDEIVGASRSHDSTYHRKQ